MSGQRNAVPLYAWTVYVAGVIALNSIFVLAQKQVFSPEGGTDLLGVAFLLEAPLEIMMILLLVSLARLAFKSQRKKARRLVLISLVYVVVALCCMPISLKVRLRGFQDLADRSRPLVDAIRKFEEQNGYPPPQLENLVPDFLPDVPETGMGVSPQYRYETDSSNDGNRVAKTYHGNRWILFVPVPDWNTEWRGLLYYPDQNYDDYEYPRRKGFMAINNWLVVSGLPP